MAIEFDRHSNAMTLEEYRAAEKRNGTPPTTWPAVHELRHKAHVDGVSDINGTLVA